MNSRYLILLLLIASFASAADQVLFASPKNIKTNVEFWIKIYTEVSLEQGLLHDYRHPEIVFEKIHIGNAQGAHRTQMIRKGKKPWDEALETIHPTDSTNDSPRQRSIRRQYQKYGILEDLGSAHRSIRFQQGQKERFLEGLQRSGAWLDTITSILNSYGVPERLKYLPHVESSFDPHAYSKVGASGMWQFMRYTARRFMDVSYLVDERSDPIRATVAAAKLLRYNYDQLQAWPLAITAYNHGLSGMKRAVRATGSTDIGYIIDNHSSRSFRFASKNFYACFIAASEVAAEPEKYFGTINYHPKHSRVDVTLSEYIPAQALIEAFGISKSQFRDYNLHLRPAVFQTGQLVPRGVTIHLPEQFSTAQINLAMSSIADSLRYTEAPRPKYYRVRRGDNLYGIGKRMGVRAEEIAMANNITLKHRIYVGQILTIPQDPVRKSDIATEAVAQKTEPKKTPDTQLASAPKQQTDPVQKEPTPATKTPPQPTVVAPAGSLPDSTEQAAAAETNRQKPHTEPVAHTTSESSTPEPSAAPPDQQDLSEAVLEQTASSIDQQQPPVLSNRFDVDIYQLEATISAGGDQATVLVSVEETLGHFAEWLDIPTWRIRRLNQLGRSSTIRLGQRISLPLSSASSLENFSQKRLEYHMALEEDFFSSYHVSGVIMHTVKRGETLWDISKTYDQLPFWLIKKYNPQFDIGSLHPGQQIAIAVVEPGAAPSYWPAQSSSPTKLKPRIPLINGSVFSIIY